ncbi:hypothetical protein CJF31_00010993 [Rutstroemia sp. NJR-2017a BVV2]|nr:hypothetical protein CJF31_00010993 [Rutstroemia sp. NJR-2017a BVV2]
MGLASASTSRSFLLLSKLWGFSGISTFAHLDYKKCLTTPEELFDIGILGVPFDTAGRGLDQKLFVLPVQGRLGSEALSLNSQEAHTNLSVNARAGINPYTSFARILDCGDIPVTPLDNAVALEQMTAAYTELLNRKPLSSSLAHPKIISLGGDHSIAVAALRSLSKFYSQPISVLHFDAHLDTWHPSKYPSPWPSEQAQFNHGSMFWLASNEGLILNGSSVHAGLRTRLSGDDYADYDDDDRQGFLRISADDIDDLRPQGVIDKILSRIGTKVPVYLSVDIDVLDPGLAPGTGTPEPGGWTMRELIRILRGVEGLNVVGADVVEVSPSYDGVGEETALSGAQIVFEMLTSLVKKGLRDMGKVGDVRELKMGEEKGKKKDEL